jgi:hypothetical protein
VSRFQRCSFRRTGVGDRMAEIERSCRAWRRLGPAAR